MELPCCWWEFLVQPVDERVIAKGKERLRSDVSGSSSELRLAALGLLNNLAGSRNVIHLPMYPTLAEALKLTFGLAARR